jgi:ribonuclease HI/pterin-4a-carbinolamine dehydratase
MWQETKHGLYKQFVFSDFHHAWAFMERASALFNKLEQYPRWQNEWNVVDFWLASEADGGREITDQDRTLASEIDALVQACTNNEEDNAVDEKTTKITEVQLYADGGSRGNPGPSASGFVVLDMSGKILHKEGIYLGITTNNQAEYQALKLGLERALHEFGAREVHVYMDSLLVINQMKKIFKVRNRDLWPVHDAVQQMLAQFEKVSFDHVPRELNKLADAEVNKCLDAEESTPAQHVD